MADRQIDTCMAGTPKRFQGPTTRDSMHGRASEERGSVPFRQKEASLSVDGRGFKFAARLSDSQAGIREGSAEPMGGQPIYTLISTCFSERDPSIGKSVN